MLRVSNTTSYVGKTGADELGCSNQDPALLPSLSLWQQSLGSVGRGFQWPLQPHHTRMLHSKPLQLACTLDFYFLASTWNQELEIKQEALCCVTHPQHTHTHTCIWSMGHLVCLCWTYLITGRKRARQGSDSEKHDRNVASVWSWLGQGSNE